MPSTTSASSHPIQRTATRQPAPSVIKIQTEPSTNATIRTPPVQAANNSPAKPPVVSDELKKTPNGMTAEVTFRNPLKNAVDFTVTSVQYDTFKGTGLPKTAQNIAPGQTASLAVALPGLKTTDPSYKKVAYKYSYPGGEGAGSYNAGTPPSPTVQG